MKLIRAVLKLFVVAIIVKGIAVIVSKIFEGDETASEDDFKVLAVIGGREVTSRATALRTGSATAVMGGIDIDLREATLDPGGTHLALKAVMGGIRLTVPSEWRVDVSTDSKGGGVEVKTSDPAEAAEGSPRLFVEAYARLGGILVTAEAHTEESTASA